MNRIKKAEERPLGSARNIHCMKLIVSIIFLFTANWAFSQTPVAIELDLRGHLENISKYGNYSDSNDQDKLYSQNKFLKEKLLRFGKRLDVLRYSFSKLNEQMFITTSKDGRFRIYSWDEQTGGTMHDYDSVFQYQGGDGKVYTWTERSTDDGDVGAFYHQIFQVNSNTGPIYLAVSTFIGSTSLAGQTIEVVRIDGERLDRSAKLIQTAGGLKNSISFGYDFFSVVDRPERPIRLFLFDDAKRTFRFPIVIEDEKTPQGRVTDQFITYRFNGTHFVKVN